jgi:hypothetical protein
MKKKGVKKKIPPSGWARRAFRVNSFVGNRDGKVRTEERTHAALLAFIHFRAFGREIPPGVHLFRLLKNLGRTKLDADSATLAISIFYKKLWHNFLSKANGAQINADFQDKGKK